MVLRLTTIASLAAAVAVEAFTLRTDTSKALVLLVIFYQPGTLSALDHGDISRSRAVSATAVFSSVLDRCTLTFQAAADGFRDRETGSTWTLLSHAVRGSLAGRRLTAIPHVDAFWFARAAFNASTSVYEER